MSDEVKVHGLDEAIAKFKSLAKKQVSRDSLVSIRDAAIRDVRHSIRVGVSPDGKVFRRTLDGRQAFAGSRTMENDVRGEIIGDDLVRIFSENVRSYLAHNGAGNDQSESKVWNLKGGKTGKGALVPLSRAISEKIRHAGGWRAAFAGQKMRWVRTNGKEFLAMVTERATPGPKGGNKQTIFVGVWKKKLKQWRREHFGAGPELRSAIAKMEVRISSAVTN